MTILSFDLFDGLLIYMIPVLAALVVVPMLRLLFSLFEGGKSRWG